MCVYGTVVNKCKNKLFRAADIEKNLFEERKGIQPFEAHGSSNSEAKIRKKHHDWLKRLHNP